MPTDPYSLPNGTLRNRLGIDDAKALEAAEADITGARLVALGQNDLPGSYDLDHLRALVAGIPWLPAVSVGVLADVAGSE
jgi:fido (protein-threonine AMPylation protein)